MKKLPIGIYNFEKIREDDFYYVDKTPYIVELAGQAGYYFLSRPRRFGKSLFLDTLKCAFEGKNALFKGLYLEKHWDFNKTYPVLAISFAGGRFHDLQNLNDNIEELLTLNADRLGLKLKGKTINGRFKNLIVDTAEKYVGRVVVLIDEYDKPILDNLENTPRAEEMRDGLKNVYSVIKDSDAFIKFCFITGVSKFSRVSIFSDLNNLKDISLDSRMGAICGYTQEELEKTFADRLAGIDLKELAEWYNGYNFLGKENVYNPFDVLLFLDYGKFDNYWFESATPSFLVKLLTREKIYLPNLAHIEIDQNMLSSFELDQLLPEAVLFQSGYLTIKTVEEVAPGQRLLTLDFPNQEVRISLNMHLLNYLSGAPSRTSSLRFKMIKALRTKEMDQVKLLFQSLFSSIPHEWYIKNNMDQYEGYYASVVYSCLASLGFNVKPEESSSHGRADLVIDTGQVVYILEFKVVELEGDGVKAIHQIKQKGYHDQYVKAGQKVILAGMDFSKAERNIVGFEWETVSGTDFA
ncbi:MAG: AAA family ATPase [Desulfobacteraceae bacterium]